MNEKVKNTKELSETVKQFLLTLLATTISIILTFGTNTWLEQRKKEEAKREIVLMILYDLSNSMELMEVDDSILHAGFEQQVAVAKNPKLIKDNPFLFIKYYPQFEYTETVEHIFSTNIETINTLNNALFTEYVSELYQLRKKYKKDIKDQFLEDYKSNSALREYSLVTNFLYSEYIMTSGIYLGAMKDKLELCKQMMKVSDNDLKVYKLKRLEITKKETTDSISAMKINEFRENNERMEKAVEEGKKQNDQ